MDTTTSMSFVFNARHPVTALFPLRCFFCAIPTLSDMSIYYTLTCIQIVSKQNSYLSFTDYTWFHFSSLIPVLASNHFFTSPMKNTTIFVRTPVFYHTQVHCIFDTCISHVEHVINNNSTFTDPTLSLIIYPSPVLNLLSLYNSPTSFLYECSFDRQST